jgi:hypothetical protein
MIPYVKVSNTSSQNSDEQGLSDPYFMQCQSYKEPNSFLNQARDSIVKVSIKSTENYLYSSYLEEQRYNKCFEELG